MPEVDAKFERYERSVDVAERQMLAQEIQRDILENYYVVPVYRLAFVNAIGPRVVAKDWGEIFPSVQVGVYALPWENIGVKE